MKTAEKKVYRRVKMSLGHKLTWCIVNESLYMASFFYNRCRKENEGRKIDCVNKERKLSFFFFFFSFFDCQIWMVEASIPRYYSLEEKEYSAPYYNIRNDYKTFHSLKTPIVIDNGK